MKIYSFYISDEPKRYQRYRYGDLKSINYKDGTIFNGSTFDYFDTYNALIYDQINNIDSFEILTEFQKKPEELYPDFMMIRFGIECINEKAINWLKDNSINFSLKNIKVINDDMQKYKMIFFNHVENLINLDASNLYIGNYGFAKTKGEEYYSPNASKIVLKKHSLKLEGIFTMRELPIHICDENIKNKLQKSGLTGFYFEKVEIE